MNKVVTFSRSADYLHQRAMRNRRDGSMLDALDLMRGALERDGDNLVYQMDLAELYCEMGCHRQSIRMLLMVLSGDEPVSECLFGMCCNYIGLRDYQAAHSLMMWFLMLDSEAIERPEVAETLSLLVQRQMEAFKEGRKHRRAEYFAARGRALLRAQAGAAGIDMLQKAHVLNPDDQRTTALLAISLAAAGETNPARHLIERALSAAEVTVRTRCIAAHLYAGTGDMQAAMAQFEAVQSQERDEDDQFLLLHSAAQSGCHQLVLDTANEVLKVLAYDAQVLHMRAAAAVNLGDSGEAAYKFWQRIVRLDPFDESAKYYAALAEKGLLAGRRVSYDPDLPESELAARAEYLLQQQDQAPQTLWDASARYRVTLSLLVQCRDPELLQVALLMLNRIDRPEVALLMRECLLRPDLGRAQRELITGYLSSHGHRTPYIMPDGIGRLTDAAAPRDSQWTYTPVQRRVLSIALRAHASGQGKGVALVEGAWREYLLQRGRRAPKIRRPAAWSAALIAVRLKLDQDQDALSVLGKMFRCPDRMISHCVRRIQRTLPKSKEDQTDETD